MFQSLFEGNSQKFAKFDVRVEFLLKTDSGYPRDAEVTLFTLANPEPSLRFNTHLLLIIFILLKSSKILDSILLSKLKITLISFNIYLFNAFVRVPKPS